MTDIYDIGDQPRFTFTFSDIDGTLSDPSTIVFTLQAPDGTQVIEAKADATSPSTGVWQWYPPDPFDQHGQWVVNAVATSPQCAIEQIVSVRNSRIA